MHKSKYRNASALWENEESLKKYLAKLKELMEKDKWPRKADMQQWTAAEKAIHAALQEVEKLPADVRLTNAGAKLTEAQNLVADFIDNSPIK